MVLLEAQSLFNEKVDDEDSANVKMGTNISENSFLDKCSQL